VNTYVIFTYYVVLCALCYRTMAKRAAENYMTDQNWDKEQPEEEVKESLLFLIARCRMHFLMLMSSKCVL